MRRIAVAILIVLPFLGLSPAAKPQQTIAVCRLEKTAVVTIVPGTMKPISEVGDDEDLRIILAGLDTDHPVVRGNLPESKLDVLRRTPEAVWMAERPTLGGVNVWTYFHKERVLILGKQYMLGAPYGLMAIGKCE